MQSKTAQFFDTTVVPTVNEFLNAPHDVRRGILAAIVLYHVADYLHHESPTSTKLGDTHRQLIEECPSFLLIRDVADASKHAVLRPQSGIPRKLSSADQTSAPPGLFEAPFGEGSFREAVIVAATLDDGSCHSLPEAAQAVMDMWKSKLEPR